MIYNEKNPKSNPIVYKTHCYKYRLPLLTHYIRFGVKALLASSRPEASNGMKAQARGGALVPIERAKAPKENGVEKGAVALSSGTR